MYSANQNPQSSIASNLPGGESMGAAIRKGKLEISGPIPFPRTGSDLAESHLTNSRSRHRPVTSIGRTGTWPRRSTLPTRQQLSVRRNHNDSTFSTSMRSNPSRRTSSALTNTQHPQPSLLTEGSIRKIGGLRATFKKMFGSKIFGSKRRKDSISASIDHHHHHQRNSEALTKSNANHFPRRQQQNPSLPSEETFRDRALTSHAPALAPLDCGQALSDGPSRVPPMVGGPTTRRNSLPTVVSLTSAVKRPAAKSGQHSYASDSKSSSRHLIRMPNRHLIDRAKRNSRSADALRDMAQSQQSWQAQERRLSEEIKYWRHSVMQDQAPPSTHGQKDPCDQAQVICSRSTSVSTSAARTPMDDALSGSQSQDLGRSIKIKSDDASVEQRITTVEVKLVDLECAIVNLQGNDIAPLFSIRKSSREQMPLHEPLQSFMHPSEAVVLPRSSFDSSSSDSSAPEDERETSDNRNSVTTTLRPGVATLSDPSTTRTAFPNTDEFARLKCILDEERAARHALESQLEDLQRQVQLLRRPSAAVPAWSKGGAPTSKHGMTPTTLNKTVQSPIKSSPTTQYSTVLPIRTAKSAIPDLSNFKENSEGYETETDTDDGFLDVYETPAEARKSSFEVATATAALATGPGLLGMV